MFDKNLFDRSAYDRSVASDGIIGDFLSSGQMATKIVVMQPIPLTTFSGQSSLGADIRILIPSGSIIEASSELINSEIILQQALSIGFNGSGMLSALPTVKTPIGNVNIAGSGDMQPLSLLIYQHMSGKLMSTGDISTGVNMKQDLSLDVVGNSALNIGTMKLALVMALDLNGGGDVVLKRLGTLNEDLFQLLGINLQPGEEVTIDTDLFDVMFGYRPDVSSVTTDSVFFDLNPGENEITISTDTQGSLQVTAIWQNRWL